MPSTLHEALVLLFRESPRLAPMLVARALRFELPEGDIQVTSAEFADLDPPEYRADVVLRIASDSGTGEVFIVEVQLDDDLDKHFTWPQYVTAARTRFRCPATLVVVTVDERVARWCAQPIALDRAGNVFRPVAIGPGTIPVITDAAQARTWPEMAVLSVIAHGHEPGSEAIGVAAIAACNQLDSPQASLYADLVFAIARAALEAIMEQHKYTYQSDFAKKYVAEGIKQGLEQGQELGYRDLLHVLLQQRFGEVPADIGARLDAADAKTLREWARRVLTAGRLADVFAADPK